MPNIKKSTTLINKGNKNERTFTQLLFNFPFVHNSSMFKLNQFTHILIAGAISKENNNEMKSNDEMRERYCEKLFLKN